MEAALLCAEHIRKTYDKRTVLKDISLSVSRGEAVALVGKNGCGKSTLIRILSGVTKPTKGKVLIAPCAQLGLVPDRYEKSSLTVARFMAHMLMLEKLSAGAAANYYRMFALEDMLDTPMKYLSKGSLQKVAAVQALAGQRDILFVDEPLSGQDAASRLSFAEELRTRKRAGTAIVMAVHEPFLIEALADRTFEIRGGILADGTEYLNRSKAKRCVFLADGDPDEITVLLRGIAEDSPSEVSACGRLARIVAESAWSGEIFRALLDNGVRIVKYEEEGTPC
jgi:ABC-type multidrug transport system ATPase subunit